MNYPFNKKIETNAFQQEKTQLEAGLNHFIKKYFFPDQCHFPKKESAVLMQSKIVKEINRKISN
jgi:hypothetical protein